MCFASTPVTKLLNKCNWFAFGENLFSYISIFLALFLSYSLCVKNNFTERSRSTYVEQLSYTTLTTPPPTAAAQQNPATTSSATESSTNEIQDADQPSTSTGITSGGSNAAPIYQYGWQPPAPET